MISEATIKLLKECNAGVKMGVSSLDEVVKHVKNEVVKKLLLDCKEKHEKLGDETHKILNEYHDEGKEPNFLAKGMSWMKTNVQLTMNESDKTVVDKVPRFKILRDYIEFSLNENKYIPLNYSNSRMDGKLTNVL